jgi:hypothetical protein
LNPRLFPLDHWQIGFEKHRMLNLFMQVPAIVRSRLAQRCKNVYECMHMLLTAADDGIDDMGEDAMQVRPAPGWRCLSMH